MSRITITITLDVPDGTTVTTGGLVSPPLTEAGASPGTCPVHKVPFERRPGGTSRAGNAYGPFWACGRKGPDGRYCQERPPKGTPSPPAETAPAPGREPGDEAVPF